MKAKKILALVLTLCMVVSLFPMAYAAEEEADALSFADAAATVLTPKLDGEDIKVTMYEDLYLANTTHDDQKVAVYVPENATADSPIVLYVNNSGWQSNGYSGRKGVKSFGIEEGRKGPEQVGDYKSTGNDEIGKMLAEGYVIVGYGCRSRNNGASEDGKYYGHSPATMSDTKAVIRYLRYNADLLPAGDPEKIVVTGTSGGGALSVIIAGTGDSADYFPALYESGAAGIDYVDGKYVNTISDAVWATVAYCPITDLGHACAAYEWTWGETRFAQIEAGEISYNVDTETQKAASEMLTADFEEYIDSLGIGVTAETMEEEIIALMKAEIEESIEEIGIDQMKADLGDYTWLTFNEDGTYTYDYEAHKYATGLESTFKAAPAFSNYGMTAYAKERNEDNLFGSADDEYSPYNEFAWENDDKTNKVGKDDTGLSWDEFLATEDGARLQQQMKMVSPFQYLLDAEGESTSAPNWYVRYGMYDRDSSWAIEVALLECMKADKTIEDINFEFAWLKGHAGNYDVQEAWSWVAE
ncbi:MAG: hypothetical protein IJY96_08890, partial [Oscillospiraceae bacterium]|nr:hypothetical protein [Oscillospiraceae bacterium]